MISEMPWIATNVKPIGTRIFTGQRIKPPALPEISWNAGGLIRWPVKILVPIGFTLVAIQGISEIIKRVAALRGYVRFETHYERPVQ